MELIFLILISIAIGILAGFFSGLFGIGGGIIMMPFLLLTLQQNFNDAKATSLFVITIVSFVGAYRHRKYGNLNFKVGITFGIFGIIGSIIGTYVSYRIDLDILEVLFGIALILVAIRLFFKEVEEKKEKDGNNFIIPLVGIFTGFVAGLFGVGGGIVMVPAMVFLGLPILTAIGTSLLAIIFISISATVVNVYYEMLAFAIAIPIAIGSLIEVEYGVKIANKIKSEKLKRVFAIALILIGIYIIVRVFFGL